MAQELKLIVHIPNPKTKVNERGHAAELEMALDQPILELIDQITAAGWGKRVAFKALAELIRNQALAYEEYPDANDLEDDANAFGCNCDDDRALHGRQGE